jgi:hypothetical protein
MHSLVINVGRNGLNRNILSIFRWVTVGLLFIADEVFRASRDTRFLYTDDGLVHKASIEVRIIGELQRWSVVLDRAEKWYSLLPSSCHLQQYCRWVLRRGPGEH